MNQASTGPDRQAAQHTAPTPDAASAPAVSLEAFEAAYERWKSATVTFEQAVRRMHAGEPGGREDAQRCARELARLHHAFLQASQPHFEASTGQAAAAEQTACPGTGRVKAGIGGA